MNPGWREQYQVEDRGFESPCWAWTGRKNVYGYGVIDGDGGRCYMAHRLFAGLWEYGDKRGRHVHHRCKQHDCVNPAHLEVLDALEHRQRHLQTHCIHGHELTPENTYLRPGKKHERMCCTCRKRRKEEWMKRNRAAKEAA